jgi:molybdopterin adenylyltransferase
LEARIGVVTVSDSRASGANEDLSGPAVIAALEALGYSYFSAMIVPDDIEAIRSAISAMADSCQAVFTTGGTGFTPRDFTPEATLPLIERRADNLSELIRLKGLEKTPLSHVSRGIAGIRGSTLIVNLPGSPKGAREGIEALAVVLEPILSSLRGDGCPH